jgi:hypothetical protein
MEEEIIILDTNYDGELDYDFITIKISARTTEDDYRCRDLEDYTIIIVDEDDYLIQFESTDYRRGFRRLREREKSHISENIGNQIVSLFVVDCPDGKQPEVRIDLNHNQYDVFKEAYDYDRNRGFLDAEYRILIHIKRGG